MKGNMSHEICNAIHEVQSKEKISQKSGQHLTATRADSDHDMLFLWGYKLTEILINQIDIVVNSQLSV